MLQFAQARSTSPYRALIFGLGLMLPTYGALAQTKPTIQFAISSQPLANALEAYGNVTGVELFYDGELAGGRRSSAVEGMFSPDEALKELLLGTGLIARMTAPNSVTIGRIARSRVASTSDQSYFAIVQTRIAQTLCADAETRPGEIDLLLQIWIAASGAVERVHVLEPANENRREGVFTKALRGLTIGRSPPVGMRQPITMAILARAKGEPTGCVGPSTTATLQ
jgi:hypothetical protein